MKPIFESEVIMYLTENEFNERHKILIDKLNKAHAELIRAENKVEGITDELETLRRTTIIIADETNI